MRAIILSLAILLTANLFSQDLLNRYLGKTVYELKEQNLITYFTDHIGGKPTAYGYDTLSGIVFKFEYWLNDKMEVWHVTGQSNIQYKKSQYYKAVKTLEDNYSIDSTSIEYSECSLSTFLENKDDSYCIWASNKKGDMNSYTYIHFYFSRGSIARMGPKLH